MTDNYQYIIRDKGMFLAGYSEGKAVSAAKAYLFDGLRMVRITAGRGKWEIGNTAYDVGPGDLLLFNNITPRQITEICESPLRFEVFGFSVGAVSYYPGYFDVFYGSVDVNCPVIPWDTDGLKDLYMLLDLLHKQMTRGDSGAAVASGLIKAACAMAGELPRKGSDLKGAVQLPSQTVSRIMGAAIDYIEKNLSQIHDVSEVADRMHVSRTYLYKLFSKYTGYTPKGYITHCRILRFLNLITTSNTTVLDAAMHCGFESQSGFYKTFRTVCGTTPTEYLAEHRKGAFE